MEKRLRNVQQQKRIVTAEIQRLEEKIIEENGVVLSELEADVVNDLKFNADTTCSQFSKRLCAVVYVGKKKRSTMP